MAKRYNAAELEFETVNVFGHPAIFTDLRVDRASVPDGLHMYEIRDGGSDGDPAEIADSVFVDFYGTVLMKAHIDTPQMINADDGYQWDYEGYQCTLNDYLSNV